MKANRWTARCSCRLPSLALAAALAAGLAAPAAPAGEVPLRSYAASYRVAVGERRIGTGEIRLERGDGGWRFTSLSRAEGFYALLTRRQPSTRTRFRVVGGGLRLQDIRIGDANAAEPRETARFDWRAGQLRVARKGRQRSLALRPGGAVHDFLTVHWLAAYLALSDQRQARFRLYRKGRLVDSELTRRGDRAIAVGEDEVEARVYEQTIAGKATRLRYFYAPDNPLLPLRIEKRDGADVTVMTLASVDWDL